MSQNPFDRNKVKEAKLGAIITEPGEQNQRDAIHIAVVPIIAHMQLAPGRHIGVTTDGKASTMGLPYVGIVDPFLQNPVERGQTFWLFLYQGQVTTLRHEWTHPAFPPATPIAVAPTNDDAKRRMTEFAGECHKGLEEFLDDIKAVVSGDESYVDVGDNEGASIYREFWADFRALTGIWADSESTEIYFNCAC